MKKLLSLLVVLAMVLAMVPTAFAATDEATALNGEYLIFDLQDRQQGTLVFTPESEGATKGTLTATGSILAGQYPYDYANCVEESFNDSTILVLPILMGTFPVARLDITNLDEIKIYTKQSRQYISLIRPEDVEEEEEIIEELSFGTNNLKVTVAKTNAVRLKVSYTAAEAGTYTFAFSSNLELEGANADNLAGGVAMEANETLTFQIYDSDPLTNGEKSATITIALKAEDSGGDSGNPGGGEDSGNPGGGEDSGNLGGGEDSGNPGGGEDSGNSGGGEDSGNLGGGEDSGNLGGGEDSGNSGGGEDSGNLGGGEDSGNSGGEDDGSDGSEEDEDANPNNGDNVILFVMAGLAAMMAAAWMITNKKRLF